MRQALICLLLFISPMLWAQEPMLLHQGFKRPWALVEAEAKKWLITEKAGRIVLFDEANKTTKHLLDINVISKGQGGLLDVAKAHTFKQTGRLLLTLVVAGKHNQATLALAEVFYKNQTLKNFAIIWQGEAYSDKAKHFGSRLFVTDKAIWLGIGDRGVRDNAQNLQTHAGKVVRLTHKGKPHPENPFITNKNALPEIYSLGHRNPQGITGFNGKVFVSEHGPRGGDEINKLCKGCNFGWPMVSKGKEYWGPLSVGVASKKGMVDAKKVYIPSIAPSGLLYLAKPIADIPAGFLLPALKLQHINYVSQSFEQERRFFETLGQRIRAVALNRDKSALYFVSDAGNLYRYP